AEGLDPREEPTEVATAKSAPPPVAAKKSARATSAKMEPQAPAEPRESRTESALASEESSAPASRVVEARAEFRFASDDYASDDYASDDYASDDYASDDYASDDCASDDCVLEPSSKKPRVGEPSVVASAKTMEPRAAKGTPNETKAERSGVETQATEPEPASTTSARDKGCDRTAQRSAKRSEGASAGTALKARFQKLQTSLKGIDGLDKARQYLAPLLAMAISYGKRLSATLQKRLGPTVGTGLGRVLALLRDKTSGLRGRLLARVGRRSRRKTAPPPKDSNVAPRARRRRKAEPKKAKRKKIGRWVLAGVLLVVALGLMAFAFQEPEVASIEERLPLPGEIETDPELGLSATDSIELAPPPSGDSIPSLSAGARPQAPQTLPEGSPYAVSTREEAAPVPSPEPVAVPELPAAPIDATSFGSPSVENGETFRLRMSGPVTGLDGQPLDDGFRVTVVGTLSLDPAGPIARSHSLVEESRILNRGDHAELTIRFAQDRRPAYRVEVRGNGIEIQIGNR
ncbi:MAG: hypothetical protein AAGF12_25430, partial [Myxococcota bacterium]